MGYNVKGEYHRARIVIFLHEYHKRTGGYPKRREIADALNISLTYALILVRKMVEEGIIKTSPPWNKKSTRWTTIAGLRRGSVPFARRVISSKVAKI
jgi:DNA-binding MarR family transcriptional regulator